MPNWVHNTLIVKKGDPQQVWDALRGRRDGDHLTPFTFNRLIPMPTGIRNCGETGTKSDLADEIIGSKPAFVEDDEYFIVDQYKTKCEKLRYDYREVFRLGMLRKKNREKYGHADWYDWSRANWGTKWDACNAGLSPKPEHGGKVLWFDTAWSRPDPVMEKLFAMFPEHEFEYLSDSVENDDWSTDIVRGGKIVEHKEGHYDYEDIKPYEPFTVEDLKRIPVDEITRRVEEQKRNDQAVLDNAIGPRAANNERMPDWEEL